MILASAYIAIVFLGFLLFAIAVWYRLSDRTSEDVVDYLRPVGREKLESLLDPGNELSMRVFLSRQEFRKAQIKRVHLYRELVRRMAHNAGILADLANKEWEKRNPQTQPIASTLQSEAVAMRLYCLLALCILNYWLLFRLRCPYDFRRQFLLSELREIKGIKVLDHYRSLVETTANLFAHIHPRACDALIQSL
jgi:hypothetical protein